MTEDEIISMMKEAGFYFGKDDEFMSEWGHFAALVAAHERDKLEVQFNKMQALYEIREGQPNKPCCLAEREACAKVCEDLAEFYKDTIATQQCAAAIRARSEK